MYETSPASGCTCGTIGWFPTSRERGGPPMNGSDNDDDSGDSAAAAGVGRAGTTLATRHQRQRPDRRADAADGDRVGAVESLPAIRPTPGLADPRFAPWRLPRCNAGPANSVQARWTPWPTVTRPDKFQQPEAGGWPVRLADPLSQRCLPLQPPSPSSPRRTPIPSSSHDGGEPDHIESTQPSMIKRRPPYFRDRHSQRSRSTAGVVPASSAYGREASTRVEGHSW